MPKYHLLIAVSGRATTEIEAKDTTAAREEFDAGQWHALSEDYDYEIIEIEEIPELPEIAAIQQRMLESATRHLIEQGKSPEEAKALAIAAMKAPPKVPLPTFEELDDC